MKSVKIEGDKDNDEKGAEGGNHSLPPSTPKEAASCALQMESPFFYSVGSSSVAMEEAELHEAPSTMLGDYPTIQSYEDLRNLFWVESIKVWGIAGPIAFNILCNYGINSFTNIIVGHLGDVELSAVAISLSVIANFSFGFLVSM